MMSDEKFWSLIDQARGSGGASADPDRLEEVLAVLGAEDVADFGETFHEKLCDLNLWKLRAAGTVIAGGMGEDSFLGFRAWIVGKGRQVFELALAEPDKLGPFVGEEEVGNEQLEYVALNVLEQKGVGEDPRSRSKRAVDAEPAGEPFEEDNLAAAFPGLAAQFG